MKKVKNEKGFTLIEMLIVLGIMGILIALTLPFYNNTVKKAQKEGCEANKHTVQSQMEVYYLENDNNYPTTIDTLYTEKYLKSEPKCPGSGTYTVLTVDGTPEVKCSEHDSVPTP